MMYVSEQFSTMRAVIVQKPTVLEGAGNSTHCIFRAALVSISLRVENPSRHKKQGNV